jgi:hypothetical protein
MYNKVVMMLREIMVTEYVGLSCMNFAGSKFCQQYFPGSQMSYQWLFRKAF